MTLTFIYTYDSLFRVTRLTILVNHNTQNMGYINHIVDHNNSNIVYVDCNVGRVKQVVT